MFSVGGGRMRSGSATNVIGKSLDGDSMDHKDVETYDAILEMLLAAGYFRVRITELSPFDKVGP